MDSNSIYNALLPHCEPEKVDLLWDYIQFCFESNQHYTTPDCERHHILPKSLFPEYENLRDNNWNLANLLYRDHYIAHRMLSECGIKGMDYAFWYMCNGKHSDNYNIQAVEYESARKNHVENVSETIKNHWKNPAKYYSWCESIRVSHRTNEYRQQMSALASESWKNPEIHRKRSEGISNAWTDERREQHSIRFKGIPLEYETRQKISVAHTGKVLSKEHCNSISQGLKLAWENDVERKRKTSEEQKELWKDPEYREKQVQARKDAWTDKRKQKVSERQTGKVYETVTCPHCNKTGGRNVMKRWHFDNCKENPVNKNKSSKQEIVCCPHCGKEGGKSIMKRWHFDNCRWKP